jgi:hypothetical protein
MYSIYIEAPNKTPSTLKRSSKVVAEKKSVAHGSKPKRTAMAKKTVAKPHSKPEPAAVVTIDRRENRESRDRRDGGRDRRVHQIPVAVDRRMGERRAKVNRRRQIDPTTCERDYSTDEIEFMSAMDDYKRRSGRMFPTCSEVLEVVKSLGYVKKNQTESSAPPMVDLPVGMIETPMVVS